MTPAAKVTLTFPDGAQRQYDKSITGLEIAKGISPSLAKRTVAMALDGELADLNDPIEADAKIELVNRDDPRALELIRHDCAHVLAEAVQSLWPGTQVTIGPVIENVRFDQIKGLSPETRDHLLGAASEKWSGGAVPLPLPDGRKIVILNPNHGRMRTNATLMEEVSHVFLGHQPSRLKVVAETEHGQTVSREDRKADEEAAYGTGAAALVPFSALRRFVLDGQTTTTIAKHFHVSRELVEYRLKVTRLWKAYRTAHPERRELIAPRIILF